MSGSHYIHLRVCVCVCAYYKLQSCFRFGGDVVVVLFVYCKSSISCLVFTFAMNFFNFKFYSTHTAVKQLKQSIAQCCIKEEYREQESEKEIEIKEYILVVCSIIQS